MSENKINRIKEYCKENIKENKKEDIDYNQDVIVVLDGIQDPGNLGTILRTVDSARIKTNNYI